MLTTVTYFRDKHLTMSKKVKFAETDKQVLNCFEAMHALRPHLEKEKFVDLVNLMKKEGYILAYVKEDDRVVAVTGYRIIHHFYCGKLIYVDDLSTMQDYRRKGYAKLLMDFILSQAKKNKCKHVDLDSWVILKLLTLLAAKYFSDSSYNNCALL